MVKYNIEVGQAFIHPISGEYIVLKIENANRVLIEFKNSGYQCWKQAADVIRLHVEDPYSITVYDTGFKGVGPYSSKNSPLEYIKWQSMMERGHSKGFKNKKSTYLDCCVDPQWHNFQEFAEWCQWQAGFAQTTDGRNWALDKDILYKNNKIYSPETCCFVPSEINIEFRTKRGRKLPTGISVFNDKFIAFCASEYLGLADTIEEAHILYKSAKEFRLRTLASKYKENIEPRVYHTLMNYKVQITD